MDHNNESRQEYKDDEITLNQIIDLIKQYRRLIFFTSSVIFLTTVFISLLMPNYYKSEVLLAPSDSSLDDNNKLGGMANIVGITLSDEVNNVKKAIAIIESRKFIDDFVRANKLKQVLFSDRWDDQKLKWFDNDNILVNIKNIVSPKREAVDYPGKVILNPGEPSPLEVYEIFKKMLDISEDLESGMYKLSFEWTDPVLARDIVSNLVVAINEKMRLEDIAQAQNMVVYLKQQLDETSLTEIRQSIFRLIEKKIETISLANVQKSYVFTVIDPAIVPEEKSKPKRFLMAILGLVFGAIIGFFIALLFNWRRYNKG